MFHVRFRQLLEPTVYLVVNLYAMMLILCLKMNSMELFHKANLNKNHEFNKLLILDIIFDCYNRNITLKRTKLESEFACDFESDGEKRPPFPKFKALPGSDNLSITELSAFKFFSLHSEHICTIPKFIITLNKFFNEF